jgi:hypothetical protein
MTTSEISVTLFSSIFDNKTNKRVDLENFDAFERVLYDLSKVSKKDKKSADLMSPAIYKPDTTRANDNVTAWAGWAAVDVDDYEFTGDLKDDLCSRFGHWRFVCYSTASSTIDQPKFRLVFPLTTQVGQQRIRHFWFSLNTELESLGDKQTKDLSRMYYIPAEYDGAYNFIFSNHLGDPIDPDELMFKHPMPEKSNLNSFFDRLPSAMQEQILEYRKSKLDAEFNWTSYQDCPFWPKQLAMEYKTISKTGWYHKMYQIMVAVAGNATKNKYAITADEISQLCRQFDMDTGNWYKNRPLDKEADRALEYVYKNL